MYNVLSLCKTTLLEECQQYPEFTNKSVFL